MGCGARAWLPTVDVVGAITWSAGESRATERFRVGLYLRLPWTRAEQEPTPGLVVPTMDDGLLAQSCAQHPLCALEAQLKVEPRDTWRPEQPWAEGPLGWSVGGADVTGSGGSDGGQSSPIMMEREDSW